MSVFRIVVIVCVGLISTSVVSTSAIAQNPEIDARRWRTINSPFLSNGGLALNQTQSQAQGVNQGAPLTLTWGFAEAGTTIPSFGEGDQAPNDLVARLDTLYDPGATGTDLTTRSWYRTFESSFDRWASISGLSYVYEADDDGATFSNSNSFQTQGVSGTRADIRIGGRPIDGNFNTLAFNFLPTIGDMVVDTDDSFFGSATATANDFRGLRNVITHEHGHGIGFVHVFSDDSNQLLEPILSTAFDGPQHNDILLAQRAYGDANEKSNGGQGNDEFQISTSLGAVENGEVASVGDSARTFAVEITSDDFFSIDDQQDVDFWDFSITEAGFADISLEALGFSYMTQPQDSQTGDPTGNNVVFDSQERSDLSLELIGLDGQSVLATSNATGLGGDELISGFELETAGTYFVRISGTDNGDTSSLDTQFYGLAVGFTAASAVTAVPEPNSLTVFAMGILALASRRRKYS